MSDTPMFSPDEEIRIQQKQQEFQDAVEEHQKRHTDGGIAIDPGTDPIAREAMTRLMEQSIEQALASQTGQTLDPEALERIRAQVREQVDAMLAGNEPL